MAWAAEANIPWAVVGDLWFSPIIGTDVYIIDRGQNFYRYNFVSRVYTHLANPPFVGTNCWRTLHYRNGHLYTIDEGAGAEPWGRRISWYNIATGVWASSSQVGVFPVFENIWGFCFQDDDTIWAWVKRRASLRFRCVRYVISTDTWTHFAAETGLINIGQARSVIMNAAGTQVFASHMSDAGGPGISPGRYAIYTIATDAYAYSGFIVPAINWSWADDPLRLWFFEPLAPPAAHNYGYLENDGVTEVHGFWGPNAARAGAFVGHLGVSALRAIIDQVAGVNPMTYFDGTLFPTATSDPATAVAGQSSQLNGTLVDDGGLACDCGFEWGLTVAYGNITPTQNRTSGQTFSQPLAGLTVGSTYHYRAFATNPAGTSYGADRTFTTAIILATVTTNPVTGRGMIIATINGLLNADGGEPCECGFQWGHDITYGATTETESKVTGEAFSQRTLGLFPGTEYHYRAFARNSVGTSYGADESFRTEPSFSRAYALAKEEL